VQKNHELKYRRVSGTYLLERELDSTGRSIIKWIRRSEGLSAFDV